MIRPPLDGLRVADFGWFGPGPHCAFLLGLMGAEVIKVETALRTTTVVAAQRVEPAEGEGVRLARNVGVREMNVNKLSLALNMKDPKGLHIARNIIAISDIVVVNFRPGVLERLGLGYDVIRKLNPAAVVLLMTAQGQTGPDREAAGYATIFAALSGASHMLGYKDGPPAEYRVTVDMITGTSGAFAALVAYQHARRTGEGQCIDLANRETFGTFIGEAYLEPQFTRRDQMRQGNHDDIMTPHNVYKCLGEDRWVSIAVGNDREWEALCQATGHPEWLKDPSFADTYLRWKHRDDLDRLLSQWTINHTPEEVTKRLQRAGVAAFPSASAQDTLSDPHLVARESFPQTQDGEGNPWIMFGAPWKFSPRFPEPYRRAPAVGEHTAPLVRDLLGFSEDEVARLQAEQVFR